MNVKERFVVSLTRREIEALADIPTHIYQRPIATAVGKFNRLLAKTRRGRTEAEICDSGIEDTIANAEEALKSAANEN